MGLEDLVRWHFSASDQRVLVALLLLSEEVPSPSPRTTRSALEQAPNALRRPA